MTPPLLLSLLTALTLSVGACSPAAKTQPADADVDNATTRYADNLRDNRSRASEAVEKMNRGIKESQQTARDAEAVANQ